jgi:hypothetical protein
MSVYTHAEAVTDIAVCVRCIRRAGNARSYVGIGVPWSRVEETSRVFGLLLKAL